MECSVIIPTRDRRAVLARCLDCLDAQDCPRDRFEVLVVDDGCTDGTAGLLRERASCPGLVVLSTASRGGPSAARNLALDRARGAIAIFLDDDSLAPPWLVTERLSVHQRHPDAFVDGPAITVRGEDALRAPPFRRTDVRLAAALDLFGRPFVTVNASVPLAIARACGGFDEAFAAFEDLDLERRLRRFGLGRVRDRRGYVLHWKAAASDTAVIRLAEARGFYAALFYARYHDHRASWQSGRRYLLLDWLLGGGNGRRAGDAGGKERGRRLSLDLVRAHARGFRRGDDATRSGVVRDRDLG